MAFESWAAERFCGMCKKEEKLYLLYRSEREEDTTVDSFGRRHYLRLCKDCELQVRVDEIKAWRERPAEERSDDPIYNDPFYATKRCVDKDTKRQGRGEAWFKVGEQMKKANMELKDEIEMSGRCK